jgi:hypothetical protein
MNTQKRIEALNMLKYNGYVNVTVMEDGNMSDEIRCTSVEEIETLVSLHDAENVYF